MKSQELRKTKKINEEKQKRVLLINPKRKGVSHFIPHNGLAILAAILKIRGHIVFVVDYVFSHDEKEISHFIRKFKPTVIGISAYTPTLKAVNKMICEVNKIVPNIPLIVGGPHATLYHEILQKDNKIDYIVKGEAELIISDLVENAKKEKRPQIVQSKEIVILDDIPFPDFTSFYKWESLRNYPIMTSRGCPFHCSFCSVCSFANNRWRARSPESCITELEMAKKIITPNLTVLICDDAPTIDKQRFYKFLELYAKRIKTEIGIFNTRADSIDEKFLMLFKKCGGNLVSLGVEHAHPEVFKLVNKGETLKQIEDASKLVKKHNMELGLSFIIGLPNDNLERTKASINFVNKVKGSVLGWSFITPYKGSEVLEWFKKNGKVYSLSNYDARGTKNFTCTEPCTETPDFTRKQRKKAYFMCLFETTTYNCNLRNILSAAKVAIKYNLYLEFFCWIPHGIIKNIKEKKKLLKRTFLFYKREGLKRFINQINSVLKERFS